MTTPNVDEVLKLAHDLVSGYETLLKEVTELRRVESKLRQRLNEITVTKYNKSRTSHTSSSSTFSDRRDDIEDRDLSTGIACPPKIDHNVVAAQEALRKLRTLTMPAPTRLGKCPIAHKVPDQEDFEHDFTVPGKPSDLGCPFAKAGNNLPVTVADPIAAEFHGDKASTRSADAGSQCPIRFLDQHSPEEIAQYFENHKHELPRSHQICVKRYQQNEEGIRQLDAKYGNLVSMIQGLGNKHKQYLPEDGKVPGSSERPSNEAMEKWAEDVSRQSIPEDDDEARVSRFDKPLRDIRVGESPSRPWGIPVPPEKSAAASAVPSVNGMHEPDHVDLKTSNKHEIPPPEDHRPVRSQIVFNGPVFFGYSPEQAAVFLQHLNVTGTK